MNQETVFHETKQAANGTTVVVNIIWNEYGDQVGYRVVETNDDFEITNEIYINMDDAINVANKLITEANDCRNLRG